MAVVLSFNCMGLKKKRKKKSPAKIYLDYFRNLFVGDISHCFQLTGLLVENSIASISVTLLNYVLI